MKLGMVGLGRMGANMTRRLLKAGHEVVVSDLSAEAVQELAGEGAVASEGISDLISKLAAPRVIWLMVPSGQPTESLIKMALEHLSPNDIIVDGANSDWRDSVRRAEQVEAVGLHFVAAGVSGGVWGLENGYNLMLGASGAAFAVVEPVLRSLAQPGGAMLVWARLAAVTLSK